jgi:hypothetical protein
MATNYAQLVQQQLADLQRQYAQLSALQNQIASDPNAGGAANATGHDVPSSEIPQPVLFVDGIESARSLPMRPNTTIVVFDKNESVFYLRSKDANGKEAPLKLGPFTLKDAPEPESNTLTRKDLDDFKAEIKAMLTGGYTPEANGSKRRKAETSAAHNETEADE